MPETEPRADVHVEPRTVEREALTIAAVQRASVNSCAGMTRLQKKRPFPMEEAPKEVPDSVL